LTEKSSPAKADREARPEIESSARRKPVEVPSRASQGNAQIGQVVWDACAALPARLIAQLTRAVGMSGLAQAGQKGWYHGNNPRPFGMGFLR